MDNWYVKLTKYLENSELNYITSQQAIKPEYINKKIFEQPIWACADPSDSLFSEYKNNVIGKHFKLPYEFNNKAVSVVSIFFPFTDYIIKSNNENKDYPSNMWLHGRIEGQACLNDIGRYLVELFESNGYQTICPCISKDYFAVEYGEDLKFSSNWSERHVAFASGLGTFGLSKGIITTKGTAGRLLSIITEADIKKTNREYTDIYEYCNMCSACTTACPAGAISLEKGKDHIICNEFVSIIKQKSKPRYGCGKCQTLVPCAKKIPKK